MRYAALLALVTALASGCRTGHHGRVRTTPLEAVNISGGPITVSGGPITVIGSNAGSSSAVATRAPDSTVASTTSTATSATASTIQGGDGTLLELKTEGLTVERRTVSNGAARIRKYVVTETQTIPVTVRREEILVERVPASGVPTTPFGEAEAVIEVPLTVETVSPVITPRVIERVRIHRKVETDQKDVTATLRTEKLDVIKSN